MVIESSSQVSYSPVLIFDNVFVLFAAITRGNIMLDLEKISTTPQEVRSSLVTIMVCVLSIPLRGSREEGPGSHSCSTHRVCCRTEGSSFHSISLSLGMLLPSSTQDRSETRKEHNRVDLPAKAHRPF